VTSDPEVPFDDRTWRFSLPARFGLVVVAFGLVLLPVIFRLPQVSQFMTVLRDFAHGPVFAGVAWITILLLKTHGEPKQTRYRKYWAALTIAVTLGCAVELVQALTGRGASLGDVITNTLGAVFGLSVASLFDHRMAHRFHRRGVSLTTAVLTAGLLIYPLADSGVGYLNRARRMPDLLVPERTVDMRFVRPGSSWLTPTYLPSRWSEGAVWPALEVLFKNAEYSGLNLFEPYPDWRGYQTLAIDLTNPGRISIKMTVRVHDSDHNQDYYDRFNRSFELEPEMRQVIRIPLQDIQNAPKGRELDMSAIAGLGMFTTQGEEVAGEMIYLTRIWLE